MSLAFRLNANFAKSLIVGMAVLFASGPLYAQEQSQAGVPPQSSTSQPTLPPQAQTTQPVTAAAQASPATNPGDKIQCRQRIEIGTRLGKRRECLTMKQWEEIRQRSHEEAKRMQRNMGDKRG